MEHEKSQARVPATVPDKLKWLDALLAEENLSMTAKAVAMRLFRHHNDKSGRCDPMQDTIAVGIGRSLRAVNRAISELREAGWIEVHPRREKADYVLLTARADAAATGEVRQKRRASYAKTGVPATPEMAHEVRQKRRTEPPKETTKGTTQPTTEPAAVAIEPDVIGPAEANIAMPDKPKAHPPTPANDDAAGLGVVRISGLDIPDAMLGEWEASFRYLDLRPAIMSRAKWALGIAEKRKGHRLQALQTELRKMNEKGRQDYLGRKEAKAADVEAGIERDPFNGRVIQRQKAGWIEKPLAPPPGVNPRYYVPPARGTEIVFGGKGWSLSQVKLEEGLARWPAIDFKAEVTDFDAKHASRELSENENRNNLVAFLDARQAETMAA